MHRIDHISAKYRFVLFQGVKRSKAAAELRNLPNTRTIELVRRCNPILEPLRINL